MPDKIPGLIWIKSVSHSDGIPERIDFENIQRTKKHVNYPGGKELKIFLTVAVILFCGVKPFKKF